MRKKYFKINRSGTTLIEVLLYSFLVSSFLFVVSYFATDAIGDKTRNDARAEVNDNAQIATEQITSAIRNAQSILAPVSPGQPVPPGQSNSTLSILTSSVPGSIKMDTGISGWTQVAASVPWQPRVGYKMISYNNKLWVIGGYNNLTASYKNDVWSSTDGLNWSLATAGAGWSGRTSFSTLVFDNKMWIMGGQNDSVGFNDVWYSTDGANWTQATTSAGWAVRSNAGVAVFDSKMWIMSGNDVAWEIAHNLGKANNDVWYSSDGASWSEATASAPWGGAGLMSVSFSYNNKLWLTCGPIWAGDPPRGCALWNSNDGSSWSSINADILGGTTKNWIVNSNVAGSKMWFSTIDSSYPYPGSSPNLYSTTGISISTTFGTPGFPYNVIFHNGTFWASSYVKPNTIIYKWNNNNKITYSLVDGRLQVAENDGTPIALTSSNIIISNLTFTNLSSPSIKGNIRIQMNLAFRNPGGSNELNTSVNIDTTATLRPN